MTTNNQRSNNQRSNNQRSTQLNVYCSGFTKD
jgi:hypothetical protein